MGKGDKRTKKGKIHNNSYGNARGKDNKRQDTKFNKDQDKPQDQE